MMLYIVERNVIYCEKSFVKPKANKKCLAIRKFKEYSCRIIFMKKNNSV